MPWRSTGRWDVLKGTSRSCGHEPDNTHLVALQAWVDRPFHRPRAGLEHAVYYLLVHRRARVHEASRREVDPFIERREMEGGRHGAVQVQVGVLADLALCPEVHVQ